MHKKWLQVIDEGVAKIKEDELELGLTVLRKVQEHGKAIPEVMLYLADVWYQLGHLEQAKEVSRMVMGSVPERSEIRMETELLLAEIALDEEQFDEAQAMLYSLMEEGFEEARIYLLLGDLYALQGLDEVAVKYVEQARRLEPDNQQLLVALSELYSRLGRNSDAVAYLQQVDHPDLSSLVTRARTLAQSGDFEAAYDLYRQALERDQSPEILFGCGMMAFHLGRLVEAEGHIEKLLVLDEEYVTAYPLLADIALASGQTEKAITALKQYVSLSGFDTDQIRRLVALLQQAGRYEEAREYQNLHDQWDLSEEETDI
ncbi:tetratricopeptide repeat protein [Brevibacillus humidisoli]|uniref:tetratricopeptide repeat protein n=1 Tax=Brevibacillus humidisoli TaxID=2895522 RepID=UPI001E57A46A|nr:tetratricopeptide repeat protein [Brevibacillus humidisoli]UFJ42763.1 tetratricopeptide repeat protein [Brevibacillus humidisoli]